MTRENAILCLKGIKNYGRDTFTEQSDWQESLDMAIKALEQEPTIQERQAENDKFDAAFQDGYNNGYAQARFDYEQESRWISVNERLPENKETVLVTFKHFVSGNTIGLGSVILLRGKPHWHVREQNLGTYGVLAWMPLPKAYREVEE